MGWKLNMCRTMIFADNKKGSNLQNMLCILGIVRYNRGWFDPRSLFWEPRKRKKIYLHDGCCYVVIVLIFGFVVYIFLTIFLSHYIRHNIWSRKPFEEAITHWFNHSYILMNARSNDGSLTRSPKFDWKCLIGARLKMLLENVWANCCQKINTSKYHNLHRINWLFVLSSVCIFVHRNATPDMQPENANNYCEQF